MSSRDTKDQLARAHDGYRARKYNVAPDIASALPQVNARRRAKALSSLYEFVCAYCVGVICDYRPPKELRPLLDEMVAVARSNGRYQIQMPRGIGKTTFVSALAPFLVVNGDSEFVEVVASSEPAASTIFDKMVGVFEGEAFAQDFPQIAVPFKKADRNSIKMMRLTYNGVPLHMEQTADHLILPDIEGEKWAGAKFIIRGFTSSNLRGVNIMGKRPDCIILDDIQTDKMVGNPRLVTDAMTRINSTILGQFSHKKGGTVLMTATPQRSGDLTAVIREDPAWITRIYPLMGRMPDNRAAWDEYAAVLRAETDALAAGGRPAKTANAYYKAHRAELDAGAEVLSASIKERGEVSAVQHAMNLLLRLGPDTFSTEYQMKPIRSTSPYEFEYRDVLNAVTNVPTGTVPRGMERLVAAVDVMNADGLRYVLAAFGTDRRAAVVGWGRYPANRAPLFDRNDAPDVKDVKIARAVAVLLRDLRRARYRTEDGGVMGIGAVGVDVGWKARELVPVLAEFGDEWATPMRGADDRSYAPRNRAGRLNPDVISVSDEAHAYTKRVKSGIVMFFHSDLWTEETQLAWKIPNGAPGSLSVNRGDALMEFAQECAADQLVNPAPAWKWAKNGPNHFGDCVKMAFVVAAWKRVYLPTDKRGDALAFAGVGNPSAPVPRRPAPPRRRGVICL